MEFRKTLTNFSLTLIWTIAFRVVLTFSYDNDNRFALQINENTEQLELFRFLREYYFTQLLQISSSMHIFKYNGPQKAVDTLQAFLRNCCRDKIIKVKHLKDNLRPDDLLTAEWSQAQETPLQPYTVYDNYFGMGVPGAWSLDYTGRGVSIAVTDVGVNTDLQDLKDNINFNLSYNFVDGNRNVTPEHFYNLQDKSSTYTDHGNRVASIIAAKKENNICSAGIAYNSQLIVLKIYKVILLNGQHFALEPSHWSGSDIFSKALSHKPNNIDIFANAWAPTKAFDTLDQATREAIKNGAKNGRHGLGNIYVVPSGPSGNGLSNNINTVTVNSIGRYGTVPKYTNIDASVLTSGLGDGNNLTSSFMVTTTPKDACVTSFNGISAATSQIAAVIALALEANPKLSVRDVQHLLIHASDHKGLLEEKAFRRNAVGKFFHDVFGFGLINAEKLVRLAANRQPAVPLRFETFTSYIRSTQKEHFHTFCYTCEMERRRHCLNTVEHVLVKMNLKSTSGNFYITLTSPNGTRSLLVNHTSTRQEPLEVKKLDLVSVHFWGELAFGLWTLTLNDGKFSKLTETDNISLTIYGTNTEATSNLKHLYDEICDNEFSYQNYINNTSSKIMVATPSLNSKKEDSSLVLIALLVIVFLVFAVCIFLLKGKLNKHLCLLPTSNNLSSIQSNVDEDVRSNFIKPL